MSNSTLSNKRGEGTTQIGLHSVRNMLGSEMQLSLFSDYTIENLSSSSGVKLDGKIERFGIDLTDIQSKIMEGILRGFTETNYRGNIEPRDTAQIAVKNIPKLDCRQLINTSRKSLG